MITKSYSKVGEYNSWYNHMLGGPIHMKIMLGTPK